MRLKNAFYIWRAAATIGQQRRAENIKKAKLPAAFVVVTGMNSRPHCNHNYNHCRFAASYTMV
jgi:hypothetical protein